MNEISRDVLEKGLPEKEDANIWRYTYRVRSHEVEPGGQLTLPSLFHLMQDGASSHAKSLGLSVKELMRQGYTWVLSRMILTVSAPLPQWEHQTTLHTWPSGNKGPFALRNFLFINPKGEKIAAAISGWLVIDMNRRRPQRIGPYSKILRPIEGHHILSPDLNKIALPQHIHWEQRFSVRRQDLDINQHVNNVSYLAWLMETLPDEVVRQMALQTIHLNFMGEAKRKDQVTSAVELIKQDEHQAYFRHLIFRDADRQELIRAESRWIANTDVGKK